MATFERSRVPAPAISGPSSAPSALVRLVVMTAFALAAALVAAHFWINIIRVPMIRPVGPLLGSASGTNEGWAPWYASPLFAAALTLLMFHLYFRKIRRWTLFGLATGGLLAVLFGGWAAFWVKNIGYTWYFVPNAGTAAILGVQPQMAAFAFGRAMQAFMELPLLPAIGAAAFVVVALLLRLPLRVSASAATPQVAGWLARACTVVPIALLGGAASSFGTLVIGIVVALIVGLIWLFVSFRDGRYAFANVLAGSVAIAVLASLPLAVATMHPAFGGAFGGVGGSFDLKFLIFGAAVRLPVFVLLSVGLIKLALLVSRATARVSRRAVPAL